MRKTFCILVSLGLLLLCGCKSESCGVTAITDGLKFTAKIEYKKECYAYNVEIPKESNMRMEAVFPENLKGMILEFSDTSVTVNYNGIEYNMTLSDLPLSSTIGFIYTVFSDAGTKKEDIILRNDEFFISGKTPAYEYNLYFGTTGLPIKVTDDKNDITAIIENATIINN